MLRTDFVFSVWIFLWFLLYICNIVPYNPTFALFLGLVFVNISIIYFILNDISIIRFSLVTMVQKILPLFYLVYINKLEIRFKDILFTIIVFMIYNIYVAFNDSNLYEVYMNYIGSYDKK